jgi:sulfatase modifying factor 1
MKLRICIAVLLTAGSLGAADLPTGKRFTNSIGMEFVRIEPGEFLMGHDARLADAVLKVTEADGKRAVWLPARGDYDERPVHRVRITRPFYMGVYEVTNAQYERFDPRHAHLRGKFGFSIEDDEAVVFVSWHEAKGFCQWLSDKEGLPYRLPTEAEWEYAARAGTATVFSTGDTLPAVYLNKPDNSWYPAPGRSRGRDSVALLHVGKTPPNPWGLYDMHGNVEEWCEDWYGPYEPGEQRDPVGRASGDFKVTRGGSHSTFAFYMRSANRMGTLPEDKHWMIGFRVVLGEMPSTRPLPPPGPELYQRNVRQGGPLKTARRVDMKKPHFFGPVPYVKIPPGSEGPLYFHHNHDAAIAECPNGDLLAIWYTTVTERGRELAMAASRLRRGSDEWEPASPFWDAPDRNDHAPALWYDGTKTLYHFNGLSTAATWGPLAVVMRTSTDNGVTWSRPKLILPEHVTRQQVIPNVIRTREGAILFTADAGPGGTAGSAVHISRDNGQTWEDPGGTIAGIHAGCVQLKDGRLFAFGRGQDINGKMPQSVSADMGKTWRSSPSVWPPIGGGQRLVLIRLKEGPLLFASFANEPVMVTDSSGKRRPVRGLFAALSYDEGKSWPKVRLVSDGGPGRQAETLDGAKFLMNRENAEPRGYLAVCQSRDGLIHLISSRNYYRFNLKWLETPPPPLEAAK